MITTLLSPCAAHPAEMKFQSVNEIYGMSVRETYSICEDGEGFLWAAAKTGILRISPNDSRLYDIPTSATDRYVTRLAIGNSKLTAYSNNGQVFVYNKLYDRFDLWVDIRQILDNVFINATGVVFDQSGVLWIGTSAGLYKYSDETLTLAWSREDDVQQMALHGEHSLVVATTRGVGILDTRTMNMDWIHRYTAPEARQVSSLLFDPDSNRIWAGTISSGLFVYSLEDKLQRKILADGIPSQPILVVRKRNDASILVGIDGQGVWEISTDGARLIDIYREDENDPSSLQGDGVYDILCDDNQRIWVATYSGGVSFSDTGRPSNMNLISHQINNPNSLVNNNVNKVLEDRRGDLWFATNNGLSRWEVASNRWHTYYYDSQDTAKAFLALCEDDDGNIWAGTYSSGVYVIDGETGREIAHYFHGGERGVSGHSIINIVKTDGETISRYIHDGEIDVSGQFMIDIFKDSAGNIWMGGTGNIICWIKEEKLFRVYGSQSINSFEELTPETMLLSCTWGLVTLKKKSEEIGILTMDCRVQDAVVLDDAIWLATSGEGLIRYDRQYQTLEKYSTETGIPSNHINSIVHANGDLWLGTESGLCRFNIDQRIAYASPAHSSSSGESYNTNAHFRMSSGEIIWGTNRGGIIVDPSVVNGNDHPEGRIHIQDIVVSGASIRRNDALLKGIPVDERTGLTLAYNQSNISVEILPLGTHTEDVKFSWRLDGLDSDWSDPSDLHHAIYNGLQGGEYRLEIRMWDSSSWRIIDMRTLDIEITPPFWAAWWFRLAVILAISGGATGLIRLYLNHQRQQHARDKLKFFTRMAHDIRTSLTLISAPVEQLNSSPELPVGMKHLSSLAAEQSSKLSTVVTQLLDFEKVDLGKEKICLTMTDVVELLSGRIVLFCESCSKQGIRIEFSHNCDSYLTAIDEPKIEKAIDNLISNAVKYSHPGGRVEIRLDCGDRSWSVAVVDHGLGISESSKKKLFREFYRGENAVNSNIAGSGIGLLMVKNYVDLHGGKIDFVSRENVGSTFTMTIPRRKVDAPAAAPVHRVLGEELEALLRSATGEESAPDIETETETVQGVSADGEKARSRKPHIFVVEDNEQLRGFLKNTLQRSYHVSVAGEGGEALELIDKIMPDLIVSDIMMPGMDGFELCRRIKSTFQTSHIPVILLTSLSEKAKQMEGFGLGADDYVTKPFDMTLLTRRIDSILGNREMVRERTLRMLNVAPESENVFVNELNDRFIRKAIESVRANIANCDFGKDAFASAMNVSPSLLYKKIKALSGHSPAEFIKTIRLNRAFDLLRSGNHTIVEVSEMCGFSNANYFSTAFKKYFGETPTSAR
jgi:signal transduction histidine kinase/CheY-like chemotaxis protein/ligand-binding sensor domain-containing protein/AraC-like DNA-binding protein